MAPVDDKEMMDEEQFKKDIENHFSKSHDHNNQGYRKNNRNY